MKTLFSQALRPSCLVIITFSATLTACGKDKETTTPAVADPRTTFTGEALFSQAFPNAKNTRSCATCHVPADNFTLTPEHVEKLYKENPNDPLFSAIDADDPTAKPLTFEHLKKGLIRVGLTLPANMDQIDENGKVITPADRKIFVWRSVPSIADVALTAPYQLDGRVATLEEQVQGAIEGHSEGGKTPDSELQRIATFERSIFSSERARSVADALGKGLRLEEIHNAENTLQLSATEERGRKVYELVCEACHGGVNKATIVNRSIHAQSFPTLKPDGTVLYAVPTTQPATPILATQHKNEFINIGSAVENYLVQIGATEHQSFTKGLSFPKYRFRFYKDATKKEVIAELPPAIPTTAGNPNCGGNDDVGGNEGNDGGGAEDSGALLGPVFDADCNPVTGPNFTPQLFTTDPGRAAITGNPYDFEAFDIPTLRGISKTAPYWHNNISKTLENVVELYSDHLFAKYPSLTQPGEKEKDGNGDTGPEEALTRQQKDDLTAYLKRL